MAERPVRLAALIAVLSSVVALLASQPGLDYYVDSGSIDSLVRGNWTDFFAQQPLMGPLSVVLRAPFVAPVFHSSVTTVYLVGLIPCYGALLALGLVLWRRMADRPALERRLVLFLCVASPLAVKVYHWGHPEEFLTIALLLGALLTAHADRGIWAGVLFGLAVATKQWAVLGGAPVLLTLPHRRIAFLAVGGAVGGALMAPMLIGDPHQFWLVTRAAGAANPSKALGLIQMPDTRVLPQSLWTPLASPQVVHGSVYRIAGGPLVAHAHYLILLAAMMPLLWLRAGRTLSLDAGLRLLALLLLIRCVLDPNDLDYYHAALVTTLAALAAVGGTAELRGALFATAGLSLAFLQPVDSLAEQTQYAWLKWLVYMATVLPLGAWLLRDLLREASPAALRTRRLSAAAA